MRHVLRVSFMSVYFRIFEEFRKHMKNVAWETEVWLCNTPSHMIHYDGERFLGSQEIGWRCRPH